MSSREEIIDFASTTESNNSVSDRIREETTCTSTSSTSYASSAKGASEAANKQKIEQQMEIAEYLQLVRKLRSRENLSYRRERRFRSAQVRRQNLFTVDEPTGQAPQAPLLRQQRFDAMITVVGPRQYRQPVKPAAKAVVTTEVTLAAEIAKTEMSPESASAVDSSSTDTLPISTSNDARPRSQGEELILSSSSNAPQQHQLHHPAVLSDINDLTNPDLSFKLPGPLDSAPSKSPRYTKIVQHLQQHRMPTPSPNTALTLFPLRCLRLRESVLSLAFDPAGRRLISVEPSRGVRFRSVASNGDDMNPTESGLLDWRIWARAVCVLPGGYLLVATPANVQLFKTDGTREAVSDRVPGIIGLAAFERSALALESWTNKMYVFELPQLQRREYHPLYEVQLQDVTKPIAMCAVYNLVTIASLNDTMRTFEIETGRLRQEVFVSSRDGPKELASCGKLGLLFVSVFCDHCILIFRLKGGILEKAGSLIDPGMKPGPLAWMPVNGVLFCATSQILDARNCELRSYALHEASDWKPQVLLPMDI